MATSIFHFLSIVRAHTYNGGQKLTRNFYETPNPLHEH